ncbi:MAG: arsenic efflux protein [Deltaproteobacteria bacterium]|nr:arsenic efflux protein [Deltaproteobacteria bacterium]
MVMAWKLTQHAVIITAFVSVMMVAIEYFNVLSHGWWLRVLGEGRWRGYLVGALLGALPGCLGAFALVALFGARKVTLGAVVAGMIATSGDEMFVMLSLFPGTALALTAGLTALGIGAGALTDLVFKPSGAPCCQEGLALHEPSSCACFAPGDWMAHWRNPSAHRVILTAVGSLLLFAIAAGQLGPPSFNWKRLTLMLVVSFGLFILATVPDHFLDEHLWKHVARRHVPRVFAWTLGALALVKGLDHYLDVTALIAANPWATLALAGAVGVIPESGPHLVFVSLYSDGSLPLGILVASSAVQDGHGMLPMLAHSRVDFLKVKAVNLVVGLAVGGAMLLWGQ